MRFASEKAAGGRPADTPQGRAAFAEALSKPLRDKDHLLRHRRREGPAAFRASCRNGTTRSWSSSGKPSLGRSPATGFTGSSSRSLATRRIRPANASSLWPMVRQSAESLTALAGGKLSLELAPKVSVELPWADVTGVTVRSDRLVFLSDTKPVESRQRPIVTLGRPGRRTRTCWVGRFVSPAARSTKESASSPARSWRSLSRARSTSWPRRSAWTIRLAGAATANSSSWGTARSCSAAAKRGGEQPEEIRVSTAGVKLLTLVVEPGADLDLSDHADWGDVRLLRSEKSAKAK